VAAFRHQYSALVNGVTGLLPESEISPVDTLPRLEELRGAAPRRARAGACAARARGCVGVLTHLFPSMTTQALPRAT
jgi:hypothetical protein